MRRGAEKTRRGGSTDGAACKGGRKGLGPEDHASRALGARANRGWLLSCRLSLTTSTPPHIALPPSPSIHIQVRRSAALQHPPQDGRRQREPEGRSPARSAGKAERSDCRAREDYGWGWAGGVIKPDQAPSLSKPPPTTSAAAPASVFKQANLLGSPPPLHDSQQSKK